MRQYLTVAVALAIAAPRASAQRGAKDDAQWVSECRDQDRYRSDHARYCEVRVDHLAATRSIDVDGRENGAVEIIGGAAHDIVVHEMIEAESSTEADAKDMASQIHVTTSGGRIHADGPPEHGHRQSWTVSYRIEVPHETDVTALSTNGPIEASETQGQLDLRSENGPISLYAVGGNVHARTQNGPVEVTLTGSRWNGSGLDAETENGPVELTLPTSYAAHLETGTVNGPMSIGFPITVSGHFDMKRLSTDINGGGPTIRVVTTNGPVTVDH
jgi:hypothetical protein